MSIPSLLRRKHPDTLVSTGQADFGISFAESVVTYRVNGLPVKSVAAVLQTNTSALATLKSSGLDTLDKLVGRRYAGFGSPFEVPVIETMLTSAGVKDTNFQNITANLSGYSAIVEESRLRLDLYGLGRRAVPPRRGRAKYVHAQRRRSS